MDTKQAINQKLNDSLIKISPEITELEDTTEIANFEIYFSNKIETQACEPTDEDDQYKHHDKQYDNDNSDTCEYSDDERDGYFDNIDEDDQYEYYDEQFDNDKYNKYNDNSDTCEYSDDERDGYFDNIDDDTRAQLCD